MWSHNMKIRGIKRTGGVDRQKLVIRIVTPNNTVYRISSGETRGKGRRGFIPGRKIFGGVNIWKYKHINV